MQHHAADHLDVEVAHAHVRGASLAHEREGLGQQVVERLALARRARAGVGVRAQLVVLEQLELGLPGVDAVDALGVLLELLALAQPQGAIEDRHDVKGSGAPAGRRATSAGSCPPAGLGRRQLRAAAAARCSRRLRRLSRWRLTWRASSSATRLIEWSRSRDASFARSVTPLR